MRILKIMHGELLSNYTKTKAKIVKFKESGVEFTLYMLFLQKGTEGRIYYKYRDPYEDYIVDNDLYFYIEEKNPRVVKELLMKAFDKLHGDDYLIIAIDNTGRFREYIRVDWPPWYLNTRNPRRREDWKELYEKFSVYYDSKGDGETEYKFGDIVSEYFITEVLFYDDKGEYTEHLMKALRFIMKYGDDFLTWATRRWYKEYFEDKENQWLMDVPEYREKIDTIKSILKI